MLPSPRVGGALSGALTSSIAAVGARVKRDPKTTAAVFLGSQFAHYCPNTFTGALLDALALLPSCPASPEPQQYMLPPEVIPHV
jgi:hypothetical protein